MSDDTNNKIAALTAEVERLKATQPTPPSDPAAVGKWRDQMRAMAERRAGVMPPSVVRDWAVLPDNLVRDIACRDNRAPQGPSGAGTSGQLGRVSANPGIPGSNTGWAREIPLGPPPGIGWVDRLCEVDAAKQRGVRMVEEAKLKAAEPK